MGGNQLKEDIERCTGKAYAQVARTEELLTQGHSAFADIPTDRPRIAIIATLEPYWAANTTFVGKFLPDPVIPTTVASVRAIEHLVDVVTVLGGPQPLIDIVTDEELRTWNLENALPLARDCRAVDHPRLPGRLLLVAPAALSPPNSSRD
jgi:hypothetical protein